MKTNQAEVADKLCSYFRPYSFAIKPEDAAKIASLCLPCYDRIFTAYAKEGGNVNEERFSFRIPLYRKANGNDDNEKYVLDDGLQLLLD